MRVFLNQSLAALAKSANSPSMAQSWHTQFELVAKSSDVGRTQHSIVRVSVRERSWPCQ